MWKRFDVVFALNSPLHIGYLPFTKGLVISPTRYYVLGRNFWGAVTKRLTESLYNDPTKEYKKIGKQIKENFRFSYFYLYDGKTIFTPEYNEKGLIFGDKKQIDKFQFERIFIGSRVLTAINSDFGTAKDESLHEIEFIKHKFSDKKGEIKNTKIIGCIWVKEGSTLDNHKIQIENNGILVNDLNLIEELTLGGEQGYGFGLVKLESIINEKLFTIKDNPNEKEINIIIEEDKPILSHLKYDRNIPFKGDLELLTGRGYFDIEKDNLKKEVKYKVDAGKVLSNIDYYLVPGSLVKLESDRQFILCWNGIMSIK